MSRVFSAFYTKKNAQPGSYRFMFDGERLVDTETAETRERGRSYLNNLRALP